jgi:imidazolonepropionase-like amidohydrolase
MDPWLPSGECVNPYYIAHPGRPGSIVDGPDEVRFAARASVRAGADFIKVLTSDGFTTDPRRSHFQLDELEVLLEESRASGKPLVAHAIGSAGAKNALKLGGFRSIEHGAYLDDESVELLASSDTWLVPTLFREPEDFVPDEGVELDVERDHTAAHYSESSFNDEHEASFKRALAAGAKIAMGTDFGNDCGENLMQLWKMHELGMSAEQVLVSATSSAAELMDLGDELGTIAAGKRADVVVVDGDPYDFRTLKQNIRAVYQDGVKVRG